MKERTKVRSKRNSISIEMSMDTVSHRLASHRIAGVQIRQGP